MSLGKLLTALDLKVLPSLIKNLAPDRIRKGFTKIPFHFL